ncbi:MAG: murein L,D-transpeptidase catalytic domain family protein [Alphaproteobacteria bacterium]|nr:murein L,D-transpeptidase catalytic domain family protein [Alphaproteobacteria bacterium]
MAVNRRSFLLSGLSFGAAVAFSRPALAADGNAALFSQARAALDQYGPLVRFGDVVGVTDFAQPSRALRFHLLDMGSGRVSSFLVAHGRGSDPGHSGWLQRFSNESGSNCSSQGAYLTSDYYNGAHGRSMRLAGLDPTNDAAQARAIVVHGAWYVSPDMVRDHGKLGRSEGCFAVAENELETVLDRLGPGRLLMARKF